MSKERLKFTKDRDAAMEIIDGEDDGFRPVFTEITEQGRWNTSHRAVVQRKCDGLYFECHYECGSTECQPDDEDPVEFSEVHICIETVVIFR